jgi:tetratricopeptide (TPR) repeat protein
MSKIAKLKDRARAFEQKSQWREALQAYTSLMATSGADEVDLGVWNRIGDIHLRLGESEAAVAAYERAADAYAEQGFHNNAIALCNKVLRIAPDRVSVQLKLGRVSAAKGFWADARHSFLTYAERMQRRGEVDASLDALKEYVDLFPDDDDTDVRLMLAEQLQARGRSQEAIQQLRALLGQLPRHQREDEAERVIEMIREIDPGAPTTPLDPPRRDAAEGLPSPGDGLELTDAMGLPAPRPPAAGEGEPEAGEPADAPSIEPPAGLEDRPADEPRGTLEEALLGLEPTAFGDFAGAFDDPVEEAGTSDALELDGRDAETLPEEEEEMEPLPLLGGEEPPAATGWETRDAETGGAGGLAESGAAEEEEDGWEESEPLPFLLGTESGPGSEADPYPDVEGLIEPAAKADAEAEPADDPGLEPLPLIGDPAAEPDLPPSSRAPLAGDEESLRARLRELAEAGDYAAAIQVVRALRELRPLDVLIGQKEVEFAFKAKQPALLVSAYLSLAEQFEALGETGKARVVYQRVLEVEPDQPGALAALAPPPPRPPDAPPRAPAGGYVDLGALILEDGEQSGEGTRFVVAEEEPSGDEERDFADMLARFRQKVSENISAEDSASHYDLGLAFKDMGLLDEAISHFQVALQGGSHALATLEVMAECFSEKGQWAVAQRVLERALAIPGPGRGEQIGVFYLLARCMEARGDRAAAVEYYEQVLSLDIAFRDAPQRIEQLRHGAP